MKLIHKIFALALVVGFVVLAATSFLRGQSSAGGDRLVVYGDTVYFFGVGKPSNCILNSRFKPGDPLGFRMTAINPATGKRDRATQLVVHLTYNGNTIDLPMRDRQTDQQPEREFWVVKWMVPADATPGILRYTVTAKDSQGHTGEYKPFDVEASQLTIVQ